jgi:hypothetical protein
VNQWLSWLFRPQLFRSVFLVEAAIERHAGGDGPAFGRLTVDVWGCVMALAMLAEIPDLTREEYELVVRTVNDSGSPAGALFHAGGPIEGGFRVVEVWASRDAADTFYGSELYRQATSTITTEPKILMTWTISGVDRGSGWDPAGRPVAIKVFAQLADAHAGGA